ncbi:MAG TPA: galactokinase family protein [Oscillospiraceae bacterium]|nr:galactokinase family protein [Oscillospiraceae bacterium]
MKTFELKNAIINGRMDNRLAAVYEGKAQAMSQRGRYAALIEHYEKSFSNQHENLRLFSAPGRTEVTGNHTDHNHGKVLAASIDLDTIAAVKETDTGVININSIGNGAFAIDTSDLTKKEEEIGTSMALVRGICDAFVKRGYKIGGFNAAISSQVIIGSGLSSSASFEVLIATILSYLFNDGKISPLELAQIARYAENEFFGKPCGLMDQMACAIGGFVYIDFENPESPQIEKIQFDFEAEDHILCIVDTGGSHADLTEEYSAIKEEMCAVAASLGGEFLRDVKFTDFRSSIPILREKTGDRAVQRAMHFYEENDRVDAAVKALLKGDFAKFKTVVKKSGNSSFKFNQNVYTSTCPKTQPVALALAICEDIFGDKGVSRVHGGGFAGTIQVFIPRSELHRFTTEIKQIFGDKSCYILSIRNEGTCEV